ncbi:MAG: PP2C family protein-serine/threonine phosphatase [Terriglobia bacterium]
MGGDYYDFLDLGAGRVALVQADISGKGISAAMLMASLQANLRSQYALAREDLARLLRSVNRLFYESTEPAHFATLFFGTYEDATRRLRYANCGHGRPVLLRRNGTLERLSPTVTVLGLFEQWDPAPQELTLSPGDTLVIYTDGVTDAMSDDGEDFGEDRLLETLEANRELSVPSLLSAVVTMVEKFSGREQEDDLTLLVARAR